MRIARDGLDEARIARIARDAGVSPSLVHYHFADRDALLGEALEYSYELAGDVRIGDGESGVTSAEERLRAMIDGCLPHPGALERDWTLWVELWLRAVRNPELRPTAARLYARLHDWFAEALADGAARGEWTLADAGPLADRVIALLDGLGLRALLADPAMPVERAREEAWAAVAAELGLDAP